MRKIKAFFFVIFSLPKTIFFNFIALPFKQAIRLPILVGYNVKIICIKRKMISFTDSFKYKTFSVRFGRGGTAVVPNQRGRINLKSGTVVFGNENCFAEGIVLDVNGGKLEFGDNFSANKNAFISCSKSIMFKDDVMLGWNVTVRDSDGHLVFVNGLPKEYQREVYVGNHVWLCSFSTILKGAHIENGSILGYGALLTKRFDLENVLIAGVPASIIQSNVSWGHINGGKMV